MVAMRWGAHGYLAAGYRELLWQHGLIPVGNEALALPGVGATLSAPGGVVCQIVDVSGYATWDEVVERADEFIHSLYTAEKIEATRGVHFRRSLEERVGV